MAFEIQAIPQFDRDFKQLAKRHQTIASDLKALIKSLEENPKQGTPIGKDCFKIRLGISSKSGGKSGGARVVIHVKYVDNKVYLISIYDKSDQSTISPAELNQVLKELRRLS